MAERDARDAGAAEPVFTAQFVYDYAAKNAVCVRPLLRQVTDRETGDVRRLVIPCGSTREVVCPPCAEKARLLRMQQCAEGWHLEEDPLADGTADPEDLADESEDQADDLDSDSAVGAGQATRRARSTRRRADVEKLPRVPAEDRSVGRTFTAPDGTTYRPSMFVTLTLGSYGKVVAAKPGAHVPGAGSPVFPDRYDYRSAAVEAMFFSRLFDRWMQNLRRCAGYKVQYFGAIEPQRRLAPHIHLAIRGAIPRAVIRAVTRATYLQLWWPSFEEPVYVNHLPWWDGQTGVYREPETGCRLPTWDQALDDVDGTEEPAVVMQFGNQVDIKGIIAPSADADRTVRYLAKYLTKSVSDTYTNTEHPDARYEAHIDRLHDELVFLPCSPECANWLRYGVQPKNPCPGLVPGMCASRSHDRENLGLGGRRVQVSRAWSGKTLQEHRADRAAVVREVLAEAGIAAPETDRLAATVLAADGLPRYLWEPQLADYADYVHVVLGSVIETIRWREEYEEAKRRAASRAGPEQPVETNSATAPAA